MKKKKPAKWIMAAGIAVLLAVVVAVSSLSGGEGNTKRFVKNNAAELTQYVETMLQTTSDGEQDMYDGYEVTCWPSTSMVEFIASGKGLTPSAVYEGFYYSPQDIPLGFQGTQAEFTADGDGWTWEEPGGDNWEYTEKIQDQWYWFEMHF